MPTKWVNGLMGMLAFVANIAMTQPARAALTCAFTMTTVNFGTLNVAQNTTFATTATFSANCAAGNANGLVRICVLFGDGTGAASGFGAPRYMKSGTNILTYNLYQDAGYATLWGNGTAFGPRAELNITLNGSGSGSGTKTVYGRVDAGQQSVPQGSYSSDFPAYHVLTMYGYTSQGDCTSGMPLTVSEPTFTVSAINSSACSISATTHNFGTVVNLASNVDTTSTVSVTCSSATPYAIGLNAGTGSGATVAARKMTSGANTVTYSLYSNAGRSSVWGNTIGTNTVSANATGYAQNHTVYGRVPSQSTPAVGTYLDTVVVTVTY